MSANRCHRVKCKTKERAETIIFIMAQKGVNRATLYPEFCGICRAWHVVRGDVRGVENKHGRVHESTHAGGSNHPDAKTRASGQDN